MKPKKLLAALLAAACFLGTTGCASQSIAATDLTKNVKKAESPRAHGSHDCWR